MGVIYKYKLKGSPFTTILTVFNPKCPLGEETTVRTLNQTLIFTYNDVSGFKPGSHGNGRVVINKIDRSEMKDSKKYETNSFGVFFRTATSNILSGLQPTDAYLYIGDFDSEEDPRFLAFSAMLHSATAQVKDPSRIHLVGCHCGEDRKRGFARSKGYNFIRSECGGEATLGRIVSDILKDVPKDEPATTDLTLQKEIEFPVNKDKHSNSRTKVCAFAAIGGTLLAGCDDGTIFWKKRSRWTKTALKLRQGVNLLATDGDSVLAGDGSCCSGATFRLHSDGKVEQIFPVAGQGDGDKEWTENIQGNVYGFARHGKELLVGCGGCAGTHIYHLNTDGRWEYHPQDPKKYVTTMMTASDGNVYIAMGGQWHDTGIYRYEGQGFKLLGHVTGGVKKIFEFNGKIYIGSRDSGSCYPTNFSNGMIYVVEGDSVKKVWGAAGGVEGFFVHKKRLYAFGDNAAQRWKTTLLQLSENGNWEVVFRFDRSFDLFAHKGKVYAGGSEKVGDNGRAVIFTVAGL